MQETITLPKKKYETIMKKAKINSELLEDISHGIKDILEGKVKEI